MRMAALFTKAFEDEDMVAYDISQHILKAIQRVMEHKTSTGASQVKKQLPPFLGGVLMLTRIAYQAIEMIDQLPPPLNENEHIQFH